MSRKSRFLLISLVIIIIVGVLAPFLASSNPDGLESTAGNFDEAEGKEAEFYSAPFPDYVVPALGEAEGSGVVAIVVGIVFTMFVMLLVAQVLKRWRRVEETEEGHDHGKGHCCN